MIRNYFKIAFRNLRKNKLYSFINIGGLSLGLTACILIMLYVSHEHSYDKFHVDHAKIFNVAAKTVFGSDTIYMEKLSPVTANLTKKNSPLVTSTLRIYNEYKPVIFKTEENSASFSEKGLFYTDKNYFNFFSFKLLRGKKENVLKKPFSLVISKDIAKKYFGKQDPLGKILEVKTDSTYQFTVTGLVANSPSNSSIDNRFIASISSLKKMKGFDRIFSSQIVRGGAFQTFLKLNHSGNNLKVARTLADLSKQGNPESIDKYILTPIAQTHLSTSNNTGITYLNVFPIIAILILLLALINYMSLSTARSASRTKEVGIRKVNGANRKNIALQFYIESTLYVTISFVIAGILSFFLEKPFLNLLAIKIDTAFFINPLFLLILLGLFIITIIGAGFYPSMVMSSFKPVDNFKKKVQNRYGGNMVRKVSTTLQFVIAVVLIIGGIVIQQQMNHLRQMDTGINRSDILMIPIQNTIGNNTAAFRTEVEKLSGVAKIARSNYPLYGGYDLFSASAKNSEDLSLPILSVDENFLNTLEVKWKLEPADFNTISQSKKIVINETAVDKFHLNKDPRGQTLFLAGSPLEIAGVVKNFNYASLNAPIDALAVFIIPKGKATRSIDGNVSGCLYVKLNSSSNLPGLLANIESIYKKYDVETPFNYQFMDNAFDAMFKSEDRLAKMFNLFVILTIIIAGLGLLGLATFSAQQRVKEIGIRKVLGASIFQIVALLSTDFLKLILLASIIASPIAWYFAHNWLQNFAYRTTLEWWIFAIAGLCAMLIALVTISSQAIKAAIANPVKSLRTE